MIDEMLYNGRVSSPSYFCMLTWLLLKSLICKRITFEHRNPLWIVSKTQRNTALYLSGSHDSKENHFTLDIISDEPMSYERDDRGRGGHIICRQLGNITYPIQWCVRRYRQVSKSSETAKTSSAADTVWNDLYLRTSKSGVFETLKTEPTNEPTSLFALSTSLQEREER